MAAFWIDWAIRSSLLLAMGLLAAVLMRKTSAKHRHVLLVVVLLASAMLPLISALFNIHELNVLPWEKAAPGAVAVTSAASEGHAYDFTWMFGLLFAIPAGLMVRMGAIWFRLNRLSQRTQKRGSLDDVSVHISDDPRIKTAMTWGWLQPRIVMPAAARAWPKDRMASVLQHEMAHIARRDWATQQLAFCAVSFLWYNPLAWLTLRRLLLEAERAADDLVIQTGIAPADYAQHLLDCARNLTRKQQTAYAGVHATKNGNLETRLRYILDPECRLRGQASLPLLATLGLAATLTPLLLVRLEGQAAKHSATERQTKEIQLVAIRDGRSSSEGGITISCTANTAKTLLLKSKSTSAATQAGSKRNRTVTKAKGRLIVLRQGRRPSPQAISAIELGSPISSAKPRSSRAPVVVRTESVTIVMDSLKAASERPGPASDAITVTSTHSGLIARKKGDQLIIGVVAEADHRINYGLDLRDPAMKTYTFTTRSRKTTSNGKTVVNVTLDDGLPINWPLSIVDKEKTDSSDKKKLIAFNEGNPFEAVWAVKSFIAFARAGAAWIVG